MLRTLDLPPLQDRRKNQRLAFFFKVVGEQLPGIPSEKYLLPIRGKRLIKPKNDPQFMTHNIVNQMARKNTKCYSLRQQSSGKPIQREETIPQSEVDKNSFFPRTTREWNNLEDNIATAESIETFKKRLSTLSSSNYIFLLVLSPCSSVDYNTRSGNCQRNQSRSRNNAMHKVKWHDKKCDQW
jgi:hypothetical protein